MRPILVSVILAAALGACTADIPVKDDFGASALAPRGLVPSEFADFNNYDPAINALLADQICATAYDQVEEKTIGAEPGKVSAWRARCQPYTVSFLPW